MARHIDADALIEDIQETICAKCGDICDGIKCKSCGIDDTLDFLNNAPTADVVPKSEVERLKRAYEGSQKTIKGLTEMIHEKNKSLAKLETHLELHHGERSLNNLIAKEKSEVAREIFEEIEFDIHQLMFERDETRAIAIEGVIANLKKKYTESCTKCTHFVGCECFDGKTCDEYEEKKE